MFVLSPLELLSMLTLVYFTCHSLLLFGCLSYCFSMFCICLCTMFCICLCTMMLAHEFDLVYFTLFQLHIAYPRRLQCNGGLLLVEADANGVNNRSFCSIVPCIVYRWVGFCVIFKWYPLLLLCWLAWMLALLCPCFSSVKLPWHTYRTDLSMNLQNHHAPTNLWDKMAYYLVKSLRLPTNSFRTIMHQLISGIKCHYYSAHKPEHLFGFATIAATWEIKCARSLLFYS